MHITERQRRQVQVRLAPNQVTALQIKADAMGHGSVARMVRELLETNNLIPPAEVPHDS